jgi:hypothetical protein
VDRWPPHLNLLHPFVVADNFAAAREVLGQALAGPEGQVFEMTMVGPPPRGPRARARREAL